MLSPKLSSQEQLGEELLHCTISPEPQRKGRALRSAFTQLCYEMLDGVCAQGTGDTGAAVSSRDAEEGPPAGASHIFSLSSWPVCHLLAREACFG